MAREHIRDERGFIVGFGVKAIGALAATTAFGALAGLYAHSNPHTEFDSNGHLSVETLDIRPLSFDCRELTTFAVTGEVGTHWVVFGKNIPGTGDRAKFMNMDVPDGSTVDPRSKVVMQTCATDMDIKTSVKGDTKVVKVNVDSLRFNSQYVESDTMVETLDADKSFTEALSLVSTAADIQSHLGCNAVKLFHHSTDCGFDLNDWNNKNKANLARDLRYETLRQVQTVCAPQEWTAEQAAITEGYEDEAVKQGFAKSAVKVEYVHSDGSNAASYVPDFTKNELDQLAQAGITLSQPPGMDVKAAFSDVTCEKLPASAAGSTE